MSKFSAVKHLTKDDIIKNGSVFTPTQLTDIVKEKCVSYITPNTTLLELGSGYGAFIYAFKTLGNKIIGTDCDETSVRFLKQEFPKTPVYLENSLLNVTRSKYQIDEDEDLFIIGNPPYNDTTSAYCKGEKGAVICDNDLQSRDFGIYFLKAYDKLKAHYICVLHPLSYLIKQNNFKSLGAFKDNYRLIDATVFSSKEFESIKATNADFPVVVALYERNDIGMNYDYIYNFNFSVFRSDESFCLNRFLTIDGIISKYPKKGSLNEVQFYTLRDINSLKRNASFVKGPISNGVDVTVENLYQYAWLLFFKENFNPATNMFLYGNLSPLYSKEIEKQNIKNILVTYAYNSNSIVHNGFNIRQLESAYGTVSKNNNCDKLFNILDELPV